MTRDTKIVVARVGVVAAIVCVVAVALLWHTWSVRDFEEVAPGVLYRATATNSDEFIAASLKLVPQAIITIGSTEEQVGPLLVQVHDYGFKNHLRVWELDVPPGETPTTRELERLNDCLAKDRNRPGLMVALDPIRGGMVTAAYRLSILNMPLAEVEKLAGAGAADPKVADAIRAFARQWAKAPIRPGTKPAEGSDTPAGPALPQ